MTRTFCHFGHVAFLRRFIVATLPAAWSTPIRDNMYRNLENLKPVLLLVWQ